VPYYNIEENSLPTTPGDTDPSERVAQTTDSAERSQSSASGSELLPTTPALATPFSKCGSVGFSLGTPIETGEDTPCGAVKSVPDRSLFAAGVSDHILYENLPNATGTFKRIRKVIQALHSSSPASSTTSSPLNTSR